MSREMIDSGILWIGEIPKGWVVRKLRNVGCFSASGIDKKIVEGESLVHIINYVDVYKNTNKELRTHEYMLVSAPIEKCSEHQVNVGDMIFTPSSETIEDIGISAVVMDELPNTAFSYHVLRFQPTDVVYLRYRKYFTNNNYCLSYFSSCATGTIRKTISRDVFKECLIVLPPFSEQQKIAEFLDRKCGEVDEMIGLQEQIIEKLKAYKQSVITEAVTNGLNSNVPMKDSGIKWIGNIPEHWEVCKLKRKYRLLNGRAYSDNELLAEGKYRILRVGNLFTSNKWYYSDLELEDNKYCSKGDLLYGWSASIGPYLWEEDKVIYHYHIWKVLYAPNNRRYAFYQLQALTDAKKMDMHGSAMQHLTMDNMNNSYIASAPIEEQQTIADYLDKKCGEIDALIAIKQQKIDSLKEYKKSIIYEYVTGKKEVV